jgi:hypothetical protein
MPIKDLKGYVLEQLTSNETLSLTDSKLKLFCEPCLLIENKFNNGRENLKFLYTIKNLLADTKEIKIELEKYNEPVVKGWFKKINDIKNELKKGYEDGYIDHLQYLGYSSADDFYYEKYKKSRADFFQHRFDEWTNYVKFFELIMQLVKESEYSDYRYYLVSSSDNKERIIGNWFEKMDISDRKIGYDELKRDINTRIDNIALGRTTVEQARDDVQTLIIDFIKKYEGIELNKN